MERTSKLLSMRPKATKWDGRFVVFFEEKLDGRRTSIIKRNGEIQVFGRKKYIDHWPLLKQNAPFADFCLSLPDNTFVDGEILIPGKSSAHVAMGPEIINKPFEYRAFALPYYDNQNLIYKAPEDVRLILLDKGFKIPKLCADISWNSPAWKIKELAKELGIEGFVGKVHHFTGGWFKVKPNETVDAIVCAFYEGEGEFAGTLGSMGCAVYDNGELTEIAKVAKGWDRETRDSLWENREDYLWKVAEIIHDGVTKNGLLSFSRFSQWREDKPLSECTIDQLKNTELRDFSDES